MATIIELSPGDEERLDALVADTGRSKEFYLREIVERRLDDVEDYYSAVKVMEGVRQGEERTYSSEDVRVQLGLDN